MKYIKKIFWISAIALWILIGCEKTNKAEWVYLFDGKSLHGWRAFNGTQLPSGWGIKDGSLTFNTELKSEANYEGGKSIIYALEKFENFELFLEWKISEGGNSGIFYHLNEGFGDTIAPEYQLIDDLKWSDYNNNNKLEEWQKTGADYAMHTPDTTKKITKPAGEWNTTKIIFTSKRVEHWHNGVKLLSFVPWSKDWYERKNKGKWKNTPDYGKFKSGYIGLQDHDSPIWFRNIKIRKL